MKYFIPKTPPTYPESYPKKKPPNAAKTHIRYAFTVTGASMRSVSAVAMIAPPGMMEVVGDNSCP